MTKQYLELVLKEYKKFCKKYNIILSTYGHEQISIINLDCDMSRLDNHIIELRDKTTERITLEN